jgi:hypothetical protein
MPVKIERNLLLHSDILAYSLVSEIPDGKEFPREVNHIAYLEILQVRF